ncbi:hypothetical protein BDB01DRAFT_853475 [Pilobolus umbonatus]|nr:hypothetical protein BDB01DRAFT_853475 [Pilobolus umbonatus]
MISLLGCIVFAPLSLYFAIISLQHQSLFFSHLPIPAMVVFGVLNIMHCLSSIVAFALLITNHVACLNSATQYLIVSASFVSISALVNIVLYIVNRWEYYGKCLETSSSTFISEVYPHATVPSLAVTDYYNCDKLWKDELKFAITFWVAMVAFFIYCVYGYYRYAYTHKYTVTEYRREETSLLPVIQGPPAIPVIQQSIVQPSVMPQPVMQSIPPPMTTVTTVTQ